MKIAILTPTYDNKVSARYAYSLSETVKLLWKKDFTDCDVIFLEGDAIVQSARNKLISIAKNRQYDQILWIDSDIYWDPKDAIKLFYSDKDVIGGTYRRKDLNEGYSIKSEYPFPKDNPMEVKGIGFGFLKMSRKVIESLWNISDDYQDDDMSCKNIFEVIVNGGQIYSEDYVVCQKISKLGFKIFLDKEIDLGHLSNINLVGNFDEWKI